MRSRFVSAVLLPAFILVGCSGSLEDIAPKAAEKRLPQEVTEIMKVKGMSTNAPIMMRVFKEEGVLEVWKQKKDGRYDLVKSYEICKWSGKLGPKYIEGDRQAPEGFYTIQPHQMNPNSSYHLSFNIGFPNAYDRANGRTGQHLMVHGACSSAGCYSMTDEQVEEIYAFARDAFRGGQTAFQFQAFPFRMTPQNMARYRNDPNYPFWQMLKEGYDQFEITKTPPKVDVCESRYVFNRIAAEGYSFEPTQACPPSTQPEALLMAYQAHKKKQDLAISKAAWSWSKKEPKATIAGLEEAKLVADWSRRRARGERVSPEPPSLNPVMVAKVKPLLQSSPVTAYAAAPQPQPAAQVAANPVQAEGEERAQVAAAPNSAGETVAESRVQVGATPLITGSTPVPSPNPKAEAAAAAQTQEAPDPEEGRVSRLWNMLRK
ncbi:murein L,D-transpeptidase family protein [Chelativorans sp. J32]|uniref:L,D-transpeptidase family protein n=1 Tax=Chelativorans sp. J32 TaxID=935840 RepID=UPI000487586D|nr:murein L,D-transpeptidase family protein [Chelativorans sp. J32]